MVNFAYPTQAQAAACFQALLAASNTELPPDKRKKIASVKTIERTITKHIKNARTS